MSQAEVVVLGKTGMAHTANKKKESCNTCLAHGGG